MTERPIPLSIRVRLAHALAQRVADEHGVDLLHVKGPAVDPALRDPGRSGTDVDVLVRPAHLDTFVAALADLGWERYSEFETGSPFEHAANYTGREPRALPPVAVPATPPGIVDAQRSAVNAL